MKYSLDKRFYILNITLLFLFSTIIIYLLYSNLQYQKKNVLQESHTRTQTLAQFITSDVNRLFYGIEEIMEGIHTTEEHIEDNINHDKNISLLLKNNLRDYIMDILIVSPESKILHWTQQSNKPNISNREYITTHLKQKKSTKLFVGQPRLSKVHEEEWFFALSKAYYKKDTLSNIIVVIFDLNYFNQRYKDDIFNKNTIITLASTSGNIYTSYPSEKVLSGTYIKEIEDFSNMNQRFRHYDVLSPLNQQARVATLARSTTYPIVSAVSLLKEDVLRPWENQRQTSVIIIFIVSLGFLMLIFSYTTLQRKLIALTKIDGLTQLYNRRYFEEIRQDIFNHAKELDEHLTVLMLDIDHFKKVNDKKGHQEGDRVIQNLANAIQANIREVDYSARYGGEEFVIVLTKTNEKTALLVAQRIKENFEASKSITVSIGISQLLQEDASLEQSIERADKALYSSKNKGRNCITIF